MRNKLKSRLKAGAMALAMAACIAAVPAVHFAAAAMADQWAAAALVRFQPGTDAGVRGGSRSQVPGPADVPDPRFGEVPETVSGRNPDGAALSWKGGAANLDGGARLRGIPVTEASRGIGRGTGRAGRSGRPAAGEPSAGAGARGTVRDLPNASRGPLGAFRPV
ncbi:MAG: hypothetical protein LBQ79_08275 [Deltaproteobacteria bacterium]|jgi:hypothetical protein|nr:hypothetical protein [Deltaproteobacteria bacterium]